MIRGMENLSSERNYGSLIKVRLRGDMTASINTPGKEGEMGKKSYLNPRSALVQDRCI